MTIPSSVTSIGNGAFYGCTALEEINFNAKAMDDLMESNCVFFNAGQNGAGINVTIGKNVTKIPAYLFWAEWRSSSHIKAVVFEEGSVCESIGSYAFAYCKDLTSITIPYNVTNIGYGAFSSCSNLTNVIFENTNEWYVTKTQGETNGTDVDLTDTTTNATYLKSEYYDYYWYKK